MGAGALEVGLLAKECHLRRKTDVRETAEDDVRWMAPPEVSWERVERELTGALWVALKDRGVDQVLGTLLVAKRPSAWCVPDGDARRLAVSAPAMGSGARSRQVVFPTETGGPGRVELTTEELAGLGAVKVGADSAVQVASAAGRGQASRSARTVVSDLPGARKRLDAAVSNARIASQRAEELLDVKKRMRGRTATALDYHEAAKDAAVELDHAGASLTEADAEIADYPEMVRRKPDPPGAAKRRTQAEDPTLAALAEVKKSVEKLRVRADEYSRKK
jgi:hypothetical protein